MALSLRRWREEQTEALIRGGVPLVIRSHNLINDDAAFRLAYFFYQSLGQATLGKACERSIASTTRLRQQLMTYEHEPADTDNWPFLIM